ncbi:unnamed protein product [Schistocephalus solidus]|uniref:Eukaryotic translation initiation factor 5 n=1 Tax=Schistocephalus solidus TaxID=70667 RepID=A0A183SVA2_SCHSO|nr:unnamed protein product [Schistocephalus solidus]
MEININHEVEDTFYRYKMPKLSAKVEGKGNGIKTVIVNVTDIAKALYRKPIYVTKYFGCELGAQIHVDEKNERYIVNGAHDASKLQDLLNGFIKKFVLCPSCGNPETTLAAVVGISCKACGNRGQLDPRHRLTQFIIKNPPVEEAAPEEPSRGRKNRRIKNGDPVRAYDGDDDDDVDWGEDTTEEAQQQRLGELSALARRLALSADVEKSDSERADIFLKEVDLMKKKGDIVARAHDLKMEAERLKLGSRAVLVVAEVLLSDPNTMISDISTYRSVFIQFTRTGEQAQKAQAYVLGAMSIIVDKNSSSNLMDKACHILKSLYDCDIVEEEVILSWFGAKRFVSKPVAAKLAEVCSPMLKWLAEAEEESSEEEEESEKAPSVPAARAASVCPYFSYMTLLGRDFSEHH